MKSIIAIFAGLFASQVSAQTYTQMQWGVNKGVTPYQFGANINGSWTNLGTVSAAGVWQIPSSNLSGLAASATIDTTNANNITSGTLAVARLPSIPLTKIANQPASQNFWIDLQPDTIINKFNDRTFFGAAADNSGNCCSSGQDWMENWDMRYNSPTTSSAQTASISTRGTIGLMGASRSSDYGITAFGTIGAGNYVLNDSSATPTGYISFPVNPSPGDTITLGGTVVTFVASGAVGNQVNIGENIGATMTALETMLNSSVNVNISKATYIGLSYQLTGPVQLIITYKTTGAEGLSFTLAASAATVSSSTLTGGTGGPSYGWATYSEATFYRPSAFTTALEADAINEYAPLTDNLSPYRFNPSGGVSAAAWLGAGSNHGYNPSINAAIAILGNHGTFDKGIVFQRNAIYPCDGTDVSPTGCTAIDMAYGQQLTWGAYVNSNTGSTRFSFGSTVKSTGPSQSLLATDNGLMYSASAVTLFQVYPTASGQNGVFISPGVSGSGPTIVPLPNSGDTNVTIQLNGTGTGNTIIGSSTSAASFPSGWKVSNTAVSATAPTIASGFGTSPSIVASNGTAAFQVNVGTGGTASSGVITLPAAANGWSCSAADVTTQSTSVFLTKQTASTTTSVTITNYDTTGAAAAWTADDKINMMCMAF